MPMQLTCVTRLSDVHKEGIIRKLKDAVIAVGRFIASPLRRAKHRKYADPEAQAHQHIELPNDQLLPLVRKAIAEGHTAIISVKGYSMRPFLEHLRDKVKLAPISNEDLRVGDAVLAEIAKGCFVLHRIIEINGEQLTLQGDGNVRGTETCTMSDVCGVVIEYIRPGGHVILASDSGLCRRIKLWRRLRPLRRYLLFFYKLTI